MKQTFTLALLVVLFSSSPDAHAQIPDVGNDPSSPLLGCVTKRPAPAGLIVMWSGTLADIPVGWAPCDGTNGTPDLRNQFVLGAVVDDEVGATGGASSHFHDLLPHHHRTTSASHVHVVPGTTINTASSGDHRHATSGPSLITHYANPGSVAAPSGSHTHSVSTTGAHTHSLAITERSTSLATEAALDTTPVSLEAPAVDNEPPSFAILFIMKLPE